MAVSPFFRKSMGFRGTGGKIEGLRPERRALLFGGMFVLYQEMFSARVKVVDDANSAT